MAKVSIIVPVYNVYPYLEKCLTSLINQTLKDIQIIVVNDGTKDNSQKIIDRYVKKDKRIISLTKDNGGLSDARNYGLGYATGEYIGFVDADDYVDLKMYEKMYAEAKKDNSDMVECDFYWHYDDKQKLDKANYKYTLDELMPSIRVMVCNKLFKRDLITKHKITFPLGLRYEDILFTYKVLPHVKKVSYVEKGLYYYVQRSSSISNNQTEKVRDIFAIFDKLIKHYKDEKIYNKYNDVIEYLHIRYFLGSSFLRILGINDKALRKSILNENWQILNNRYPQWKKNKYLKSIKNTKNMYYKHINKVTYKISSHLFRLKSR